MLEKACFFILENITKEQNVDDLKNHALSNTKTIHMITGAMDYFEICTVMFYSL